MEMVPEMAKAFLLRFGPESLRSLQTAHNKFAAIQRAISRVQLLIWPTLQKLQFASPQNTRLFSTSQAKLAGFRNY